MNCSRIGKFLFLMLVNTQDLLIEMERKFSLIVAAYIFSRCGLYAYAYMVYIHMYIWCTQFIS